MMTTSGRPEGHQKSAKVISAAQAPVSSGEFAARTDDLAAAQVIGGHQCHPRGSHRGPKHVSQSEPNVSRRVAVPRDAGDIAIAAPPSHIVAMANDQPPERPRVEPEILPPERSDPRRTSGIFVRVDQLGGVRRVIIPRPGLPSIMFALLVIALVAALVFVALAGLILFWIPILIIGFVAAILSRVFGGRR